MNLDKKTINKSITILAIFIFTCILIRIGIAIWKNYNLVNNFIANPNEPYQQRIPIAEEKFIDDYIYRLYFPFATDLLGRPNTFVLKKPISYYSAPDDNLEPVITIDSGKKYIITTNDINSYKYGIQSWPTYKKGWRYVIPFAEVGNEKSVTSAYFVKLEDLFGSLKSIKLYYHMPKGYNNRRTLLIKDEMLYKEGYYLSPDLLMPIIDSWNITLLASAFFLIIIRIIFRKITTFQERKK
ncbi:MAG TPA: hypothetical protein PK733_16705 [Clostridiales bacterium]|nr:hypothetical protein [Clostridiales bacterium]